MLGSMGDGLHEHRLRGRGELRDSWDSHTWTLCSTTQGDQLTIGQHQEGQHQRHYKSEH